MGKSPRPPRRPTFIAAHLRNGDEWIPVKIGNLSATGVMVKATSRPAVGTHVELRRRGVAILGEVVWSTGTRFGVRSFEAIDQAALGDEQAEQPSKVPPPQKPSFWHWRKSR